MIRHASAADAAPVAELISRFFQEEGFDVPPEAVRQRADVFLSEAANAVFLAEQEGVAVGVATVTTVFGFETGRYAEVEDLYVLPAHRGRGVAAALLDAALAWCRSRGCSDVEVVVTPEAEQRHGLLDWYHRRGWVNTGRLILVRVLE